MRFTATPATSRISDQLLPGPKKMTPPCKIFKAGELESAVQTGVTGRKRKTEGGQNVDISQCPLFSMVQYDCQIERPDLPHSPVQCFEVQRWFRK